MKIAIIGAGTCGLSCALECERLGIIPDVFERDSTAGWVWPMVIVWPEVLSRGIGDAREHLREKYNIDIKPLAELQTIIMKSQNREVKIEGKLGYLMLRGKHVLSLENQLLLTLNHTPVSYNRPVDYKELSKKYDYVVVASGNDTAARDMGVWEDCGRVSMIGGIALGSFVQNSVTVYLNTDYAGSGFALITPFNKTRAAVTLYIMGLAKFDENVLFSRFLQTEGLEHLQFMVKFLPPACTTGRVKSFKLGNVLLAGTAAGLTDRFVGMGCAYSIMSGVLSARAIVQGLDYEKAVRPLQEHVERISVFREKIESFENKDYDRLLSLLGTPGIKQLLYNTGINFADILKEIDQ